MHIAVKKSRMRRLLTILLSIILTLSLCVGCAPGPGETAESTGPTTDGAATSISVAETTVRASAPTSGVTTTGVGVTETSEVTTSLATSVARTEGRPPSDRTSTSTTTTTTTTTTRTTTSTTTSTTRTSSKKTTTTTKKTTTTTTTTRPQQVTVTLSVECHNAIKAGSPEAMAIAPDGMILAPTPITVPNGATAYDVMQKSGLVINAAWNPTLRTYYIKGIQGLGEKAVGRTSGWLYKINGTFPNVGLSLYEVQPGDVISFHYTVRQGDVPGSGF